MNVCPAAREGKKSESDCNIYRQAKRVQVVDMQLKSQPCLPFARHDGGKKVEVIVSFVRRSVGRLGELIIECERARCRPAAL